MKKSLKTIALSVLIVALPALAHASKTHKIKKSDTLYSLARKYHVSVKDIKAANNLYSKHIKSGDVLVIPPRLADSGSHGQSGQMASQSAVYRVKRGENLKKIAGKTGLSVKELRRLNGLKGNRLKPGTVLVLKNTAPVVESKPKIVSQFAIRNKDLLNDNEFEQNLAEVAQFDPEKKVDLNKNVELSLDVNKRLKKTAYSFLGTRYRFGGTTRKGMDCSSFVQHVFRELEVSLPRTAREQYWVGEKVTPSDLQKGDLLFFRTYASFPSHVGIYLGGNKMIHASSRDQQVVISPITGYYRSRFIGAKRLAKMQPELLKLEDLLAGTGAMEEVEEDVVKNDTMGLSLAN